LLKLLEVVEWVIFLGFGFYLDLFLDFWVWLEQSLDYRTWGLIRFGQEKRSTKCWEKWSTKCRETGVQNPEKNNLPSCTKASWLAGGPLKKGCSESLQKKVPLS